ncbi:MAG: hypothetical protein NWE92_11410 [Candidatus Bathyarchaeota archaeon]|nr:hypothetical protein [Candidatus Bathyarchaeota archaeon]
MPSLDIAMPIALFLVVTVAMFLNKRVEGKLMATVEQKEFKNRDIIMLVIFMTIVISVIAVTSFVAPEQMFTNVFMLLFLGSYTVLLYTFSYIFSSLTKVRSQIISAGFGAAAVIAGAASLTAPLADSLSIYRAVAFFGLAAFCFGSIIYEQRKALAKARWYLAVQPPVLFILLFAFFNVFYGGAANIWTPYLMDVFGFTFAILIILYLSSLFSWKTVGLFAILLTIMDIVLVIVTPVMMTTANTFTSIGLPVLVYLPNVPLIIDPTTQAILNRGLGLGDFFFAGVLAIQTFNKFGKKTALISVISMSVAFGIWEAFLRDILNILDPLMGRSIGGFPGTLMILTGWAPIVAVALLMNRNKPAEATVVVQSNPVPEEQGLPIQ